AVRTRTVARRTVAAPRVACARWRRRRAHRDDRHRRSAFATGRSAHTGRGRRCLRSLLAAAMMRTTWKIAALLFALVLISGFAGYYLGFQVAKAKARARSNPDAWNVSAMNTLDRKLKLTPTQHDKIQAIIDGGVNELRDIRIDTIEKSNRVLERMISEV